MVDVLVLPSTAVLVTLVLLVDDSTTLVVVVVVAGVNVTWNEIGKVGIVNLQTYPVAEPQDTPLVKWYPETCHPGAAMATIETVEPTSTWQPPGHEGVSWP